METPGVGDDDRLSDLPDSLLEDMLSRLTSRQAVRTSVLSRRWRHLWRAVRCVDIDQREFFFLTSEAPDPGLAIEERMRRMVEEWDALEDLADALLAPTQQGHAASAPPLDAVRLRFAAVNFHAARRWVRRGLWRRPAAFHLLCDYRIDTGTWPVFPSPTLLRLRTLHLSGLMLPREFADDVAAECPVLEDLQLRDCKHGFSRLASRSLRTLLMDGWKPEWMALVASRVVELRVHGRGYSVPVPVTTYPESEVPDLVTVALKSTWPRGAMALLGSLRHARNLSLTSFPAAAFHGRDFPVFHDLRTLLLDGCDVGARCQVLRRFLGSCPSLETLALRNCVFGNDSYWSKQRKKASSSSSGRRGRTAAYDCSNLKSIELEFADGTAVEGLYDTLQSISKGNRATHPSFCS
ncbi:hypothetical protein BS78_05G186700 [Paspalum vaginatum]|nr:hypothetical protein BS78_05G186700 [Paspalum vaginatum]